MTGQKDQNNERLGEKRTLLRQTDYYESPLCFRSAVVLDLFDLEKRLSFCFGLNMLPTGKDRKRVV